MQELDRLKVLNWWTGRISDQDLSDWTGMSKRNVRMCLSTPYMKSQVFGGGRGSKVRRLSVQARNSVAIIHAMNIAGFPIDTAINIISATPFISLYPNGVVDFTPPEFEWPYVEDHGNICLAKADPDGGWLETDVVPKHVFSRQMLLGDPSDENAAEQTARAVYQPELDPLGFYLPGNSNPDVVDRIDSKFYVVDGKWVLLRHSSIDSYEAYFELVKYQARLQKEINLTDPEFLYEPAAMICKGGQVKSIAFDLDLQNEANAFWNQSHTKLEVNSTLAIRMMKRRAYGLI